MAEQKFDETGGFSQVQVILSDVLPPECFHPDFLKTRQGQKGSARGEGKDK